MKRARLVLAAALLLGASSAYADTPVVEARSAYARGSRAFEAHDYALAAREFARADAIVPSDAAIEAALEASLRAGDPVLGMELVERARSRALDPRAARASARVAAAFASRVGRIVLPCEGATSCRVVVDGAEIDRPRAPVIVAPGRHVVRVARDERVREASVDVAPEATVNVPPPDDGVPAAAPVAAPPPPPPPPAPSPEPPPPAVAFVPIQPPTGKTTTIVVAVGTALTLGLVGGTAASYFDVRAKRRDFDAGACGTSAPASVAPAGDCSARADAGRSAETRTWILLGASAAVGVATATLAVWRPWQTRAVVTASAQGVALGVEGKLP